MNLGEMSAHGCDAAQTGARCGDQAVIGARLVCGIAMTGKVSPLGLPRACMRRISYVLTLEWNSDSGCRAVETCALRSLLISSSCAASQALRASLQLTSCAINREGVTVKCMQKRGPRVAENPTSRTPCRRIADETT